MGSTRLSTTLMTLSAARCSSSACKSKDQDHRYFIQPKGDLLVLWNRKLQQRRTGSQVRAFPIGRVVTASSTPFILKLGPYLRQMSESLSLLQLLHLILQSCIPCCWIQRSIIPYVHTGICRMGGNFKHLHAVLLLKSLVRAHCTCGIGLTLALLTVGDKVCKFNCWNTWSLFFSWWLLPPYILFNHIPQMLGLTHPQCDWKKVVHLLQGTTYDYRA